MTDFKIEDKPFDPKNVIPKIKRRVYPWNKLKVGQSFYCEPHYGQDKKRLILQLKSASWQYAYRGHTPRHPGYEIEIAEEGAGVRVYRVA